MLSSKCDNYTTHLLLLGSTVEDGVGQLQRLSQQFTSRYSFGAQTFSLMYEPTIRPPSTGLGQEKLQHEEHGICHEAPPPAKVLLATDSCRERQSRFLLRVKATHLRVYEQHIFCLMVLFLFFTHVMLIFLFRSEQVRCPFQLQTPLL